MIKEKGIVLESSKIHVAAEKIFKVSVFGPDNYRSAVISHYLRTKDRKLKKHAIEYAKDLLEGFISGEITNAVAEDALKYLIKFEEDIVFPTPANPKFTFIDLFAGIGGFRIAMQKQQGKCVFSSEWDKMAQRTYYANFGEIPFGDITKPETKQWIPDKFDVICGGFPCQPFSIAGVTKKKQPW
jgi:DNA (cytosine-5)-methyltransferase 1